MCMWVLGGARIILLELQPFEPSHLGNVWYGVCVINSSYSFQWIILKSCIFVVDILKICM